MKKAVYGIVSSSTQAEVVVTALKNPNFSSKDIARLLSDETGTIDFVRGNHTKAPEGAATGAGAGGLLGGGVGWLIGMGSLVIPGVGPFIAGGPIVAALSVAAVGAAWGGLTGALIGLEIPKYEAKIFERKLSKDGSLISVHTEILEEQIRVKEIFAGAGHVPRNLQE